MKRGNETNVNPKRSQGGQDFVGSSGTMHYPTANPGMNLAMPNRPLMMASNQYMGGMPVQQRFDGMHGSNQIQMPGSWGMPMNAAATAAEEAAAEEARNVRGGYKCSKCGLPKKGHICAYQPRLRRRDDDEPIEKKSVAIQVEIDPSMTVRELDLTIQGTSESYPHLTSFDQTNNSSSSSSSSSSHSNEIKQQDYERIQHSKKKPHHHKGQLLPEHLNEGNSFYGDVLPPQPPQNNGHMFGNKNRFQDQYGASRRDDEGGRLEL